MDRMLSKTLAEFTPIMSGAFFISLVIGKGISVFPTTSHAGFPSLDILISRQHSLGPRLTTTNRTVPIYRNKDGGFPIPLSRQLTSIVCRQCFLLENRRWLRSTIKITHLNILNFKMLLSNQRCFFCYCTEHVNVSH